MISCSDSRISSYEKIINQTDKIQIHFKSSNKSVELNETQVENFKKILKQNVEPTNQKKIIADIQVDFYSDDKRIGFIMITDNSKNPFANFGSDKLSFGFKLTYGIGMFLNDHK